MFKAPTQTPHITTLIDDMPTRDLKRIASHLGLSVDTLQRYKKTGNAPRLVHLALFWESRWGLSVLDCDIWNRETLRLGIIDCLQRENAQLKAQLSRLVALSSNGAANDVFWGVNCERTLPAAAMRSREPVTVQSAWWPPVVSNGSNKVSTNQKAKRMRQPVPFLMR